MTIGQIPGTNGGASTQVEPTTLAPSPTLREIPYDFVARFELVGKRGERTSDVINVSTDGAFVAVSIGYSFVPARPPASGVAAGGARAAKTFGTSQLTDLIAGFYSDPVYVAFGLARLLGIDFYYSIVDSATGRELQNRSVHNIAGLGDPNGRRPFRPMAQPMLFMPRSSIRIEVEEISEGPIYVGSELFIVLHGYKILGYGGAL